MFGWVDKTAGWIYRRGQSIVDARDQSMEERRKALRDVRDVHEIDAEQVRRLVGDWKSKFDGIGKGWKEATDGSGYSRPPGYPEPAWTELRDAARASQERIGEVLRGLLAESG